jgi:hypothetical protein
MILRRFLGGYNAASRGHGKEAHEQRSGPPIQVQVNTLFFWQLLYVHYAAHDGWYSVVCVSSVLIVNFKRSNFKRSNLVSLGLGLAWTAIADTAISSVHPVPIP